MNKKIFLGALVILAVTIAGASYFLFLASQKEKAVFPTYFTYNAEELSTLKKFESDRLLNTADIKYFDEVLYRLISKNSQNKTLSEEAPKIYAYFMVAERDFASLSYNISGSFAGSFEPLVKDLFCEFFPLDCEESITIDEADIYSEKISNLVLQKIKERRVFEKDNQKQYEILKGEGYWGDLQTSTSTIKSVSETGWFVTKIDQFRPSPPPLLGSDQFKDEQRLSKELLEKVTPEQKLATVLWTAGPGSKMVPGILIEEATEYMLKNSTSLQEMIFIRFLLATAIDDANMTSHDAKYTYQVKRPYMVDPTIITVIPTPNNPSYPSSQATVASTAATILSHFFPENKTEWERLAEEAGMSRVWGGIHYMMDHEAGKILGRKVGEEALKASSSPFLK